MKAIIIDDEGHCIDTLKWQLSRYCLDVVLLDSFTRPDQGLLFLQSNQVDIVFLDIDMPGMNGFELLKRIEQPNFSIIFTTAHDKFALQAIKMSALDYLVKPIDEDELIASVSKAAQKMQSSLSESIEHLLSQIQQNKISDQIFLPTLNGLEFIDTELIERCESDSNYTTLFIEEREKLVVSRTLKEIETVLKEDKFFRVHHSHLVNLKKVTKYVKGDGGHLVMRDTSVVPVSRARKQALLDYLKL